MDRLRAQVTLALLGLLIMLSVVDAVDCVVWGNRYEIPPALIGVVGTAVGGLYAPELLRRLRNGHSDDKTKPT